jgi:hypothetical protein
MDPPKSTKKYVERWGVESDDLEKDYVVSRARDGSFGCSCPAWRFHRADAGGHRPDCKHIDTLRAWLRRGGDTIINVGQRFRRARPRPIENDTVRRRLLPEDDDD